ncbi:MAG: DNA mismatch repair endonuclease MutL, partial [Planctomycetota bacterium]
MPDITQLPTSVINKIAAGEVIERPASVVKELLENSVDAGATRIDVSIEKGGSELIRIADNGCGISAEQLKLAVASHATSKIRDADDLFHVRSLGFRGEALASISEVSHFLMRSRTQAAAVGAEMAVTAGTLGEIAPCGCPIGTSIEVRNLFCSTPVRRKFLRTPQTEMGHISEAFTRIALAHPAIHFTLQHNDRTLYDLPADDNWRERITTFFGREIGDALIWVDNRDEESSVRLSGYGTNPSHSRSNNRMQYLFLNQRFIRDRSLQHALGEAYRGLLMTGRFPIAFLRLDMPAEMVDVNVHPTKLEVRFQDGGRVYSQLLGTLRSKFLSSDLTAKESLAAEKTSDKEPAVDPARAEQLRREMTDWAKGVVSGEGSGQPSA